MGVSGGRRELPGTVRVVNASKGTVVAERVVVARSAVARGRGLMFRKSLDPGSGLLIDPCSSIHSMWMRFPIDVLYVNNDDAVVRTAFGMPPWRIGPLFTGGRFVIELPEGVIAASRTEPGDQLAYERAAT